MNCKKSCLLWPEFSFFISESASWNESPSKSSYFFSFFHNILFAWCPILTVLEFPLGKGRLEAMPWTGSGHHLLPCVCLLRITYTKVWDFSSGLGLFMQSSFGWNQIEQFFPWQDQSLTKQIMVLWCLLFVPITNILQSLDVMVIFKY